MTAQALHPSRTPIEHLVASGVRKLYPYLNRFRNPLGVTAGGRRAAVHHGGLKDHYFAIYQCFHQHQYELPVPLFTPPHHTLALDRRYGDIVAAGQRPLIVDCGANIGASIAWFGARYPAARILAIEPAPENLPLLHRNAEGTDTVVIPAAIGAEDGRAVLHGNARSPLSFQVTQGGDGAGVDVVSLPSVLERADGAEPFILKIDIEGAEAGLFASHHEMLARFPLIILEPHDFCMPGSAVSAAFFAFHSARRRDFLFANENVFSVDYAGLMG